MWPTLEIAGTELLVSLYALWMYPQVRSAMNKVLALKRSMGRVREWSPRLFLFTWILSHLPIYLAINILIWILGLLQ